MKRGDKLKLINLIKFRLDHNLKSKEMAEILGYTATKYSEIENGKRKPPIEMAALIEEIFEVDNVLSLFKT